MVQSSGPPLVSVIMPVYNAERYVAEAVESILGQTFRDFEFLIIDDGSTDNSLSILRGHQALDPRIHLISRPNTGYVIALNEMLALARGEFIARMDADDVSLPQRIELQLAYLRCNEDVAVVGTSMEWIDPEGEPLRLHFPPEEHADIEWAHIHTRFGAIAHPSAMMRATIIRGVGAYDPKLLPAEDLDLWLRVGEVARLANMPEVLLKYRWHFGSVSHVQGQRQRNAAIMAVNNALIRRGQPMPEAPLEAGTSTSIDYAGSWLTYAWWALKSGNHRTARKYMWRRLVRRPLSLDTWRLIACIVRGH